MTYPSNDFNQLKQAENSSRLKASIDRYVIAVSTHDIMQEYELRMIKDQMVYQRWINADDIKDGHEKHHH